MSKRDGMGMGEVLSASGAIRVQMLALAADLSVYREAGHAVATLQLCKDLGGVTPAILDQLLFGGIRLQTAEQILSDLVTDSLLFANGAGGHDLTAYGIDSLNEGKAWVRQGSGLWVVLILGGGDRGVLTGAPTYIIRQLDGREPLGKWHPVEHLPRNREWAATRELVSLLNDKASIDVIHDNRQRKVLLTPLEGDTEGFRWRISQSEFEIKATSDGDGWWNIGALQAFREQGYVTEFNLEARDASVQGIALSDIATHLGWSYSDSGKVIPGETPEGDESHLDLVNLQTNLVDVAIDNLDIIVGKVPIAADSRARALAWFTHAAEGRLGTGLPTVSQVRSEIDRYLSQAGISDHPSTEEEALSILRELGGRTTTRAAASRLSHCLDFP